MSNTPTGGNAYATNGGKGGAYAQPPLSGQVPQVGTNPYTNAAQGMQSAFGAVDQGMAMQNAMMPWAAQGYNPAMVNQPGNIAGGMGAYYNPYQQQVVNQTANTMTNQRDQALNQVQGQAAQAGAFGGGRQGLVEQGIYSDSQNNIGNMAGQLNMQGFNTAAGLAGQDINNQMQTGFANQGAANQAGQFNAQHSLNAMNSGFGNAMGAAGMYGNLADQSMGMGQDITNQQWQQGQYLQQMQQALMGQSQDYFNQYTNQPQNLLELRLASLGMNPMNNTGTTTQANNPGAYGMLGGLLGAGANMFQMNPIMLGS